MEGIQLLRRRHGEVLKWRVGSHGERRAQINGRCTLARYEHPDNIIPRLREAWHLPLTRVGDE